MIIIDDKKVVLAKSFIKTIKDSIGDGRYLQTPKELLTRHQTQKDDRTILVGPHMGNILYIDTFYGEVQYNEANEVTGIDYNKGRIEATTHKVRYCETADLQLDGTYKNFKPEYLTVGGTNKPNTLIIQQEDFEKMFFLDYITRKISTSRNAKANTKKDYVFEITNPAMDATVEGATGKWKRRAENRVWEDESEGGFTVEELRNIGRHLQLPLNQYRNTDQLRKAILVAAQADETARQLSGDPKIKGFEYILMLGNKKGPDYELRELIANGIEKGIVKHDVQRKQWVWMKDGNVVGNICPVDDSAPIKINTLISFLKLDVETRDKMVKLVAPPQEVEEVVGGEEEPEKPKVKKAK